MIDDTTREVLIEYTDWLRSQPKGTKFAHGSDDSVDSFIRASNNAWPLSPVRD